MAGIGDTQGFTTLESWFGCERFQLSDDLRKVDITIGPSLEWDKNYLSRLRRAGDIPGITPVLEAGITSEKRSFVVSPTTVAPTIDSLIEDQDRTWQDRASAVESTARILHEAHCRDLYHGGLSPKEIHIINGDSLVVSNVGLGLGGRTSDSNRWAAPEIRSGEEPTERSDLYSLAKLLEFLLADELKTSPRPLRRLIMWSKADVPEARPPSAAEFADTLAGIIGPERAKFDPAFLPTAAFRQLADSAAEAVDTRQSSAMGAATIAAIDAYLANHSSTEEIPVVNAHDESDTIKNDSHDLDSELVIVQIPDQFSHDVPKPPSLLDGESVRMDDSDVSLHEALPGPPDPPAFPFGPVTELFEPPAPTKSEPQPPDGKPSDEHQSRSEHQAGMISAISGSGSDSGNPTPPGGTAVSGRSKPPTAGLVQWALNNKYFAPVGLTAGALAAIVGVALLTLALTESQPATFAQGSAPKDSPVPELAGGEPDPSAPALQSSVASQTDEPNNDLPGPAPKNLGSPVIRSTTLVDQARLPDSNKTENTLAGPIDADDAGVQIVHGLPGQKLDVYLDGAAMASNLEAGSIAGPIDLPDGTYRIQFFEAGSGTEPPANASRRTDRPIAVQNFRLEGTPVSIVAHADIDGSPTAAAFDEHLAPIDPGKSRLSVRNLMAAEDAQLFVNGNSLGSVGPGQETVSIIAAGPVSVDLRTVRGETLASAEIVSSDGESLSLAAVGDPDHDRSDMVIQRFDGLETAPVAVPSGNSGLRAANESSLLTVWLVLAVIVTVLITGGLITKRSRLTL